MFARVFNITFELEAAAMDVQTSMVSAQDLREPRMGHRNLWNSGNLRV